MSGLRSQSWFALASAVVLVLAFAATASAAPRKIITSDPGYDYYVSGDGRYVLNFVPMRPPLNGTWPQITDLVRGKSFRIHDSRAASPGGISRDGKTFVYVGRRRGAEALIVRSVSSRRVLAVKRGVHLSALSPDGRYALVSRPPRPGAKIPINKYSVLNLRSGKLSPLPRSSASALRKCSVFHAVMSDRARVLVLNCVRSGDYRFNVVVDRSTRTYRFFPETSTTFGVSDDGRSVVIPVDTGGIVSLFDVKSQAGSAVPAHAGITTSASISGDGKTIAVACASGTIATYDRSTSVWSHIEVSGAVTDVRLTSSGNALLYWIKPLGVLRQTLFSININALRVVGANPPEHCGEYRPPGQPKPQDPRLNGRPNCIQRYGSGTCV